MEQLKEYEGQLFLKLRVDEYEKEESEVYVPRTQIFDGSFGGPKTPLPTRLVKYYRNSPSILTGIVGELDDSELFPAAEMFWWHKLDEANGGPEKICVRFKGRYKQFQDELKDFKTDDSNGLMLWNGMLPVLYKNNLGQEYEKNPEKMEAPFLPFTIPEAILVGNEMVKKYLEIDEEVKSTKDIHEVLLTREWEKYAGTLVGGLHEDARKVIGNEVAAINYAWHKYWEAPTHEEAQTYWKHLPVHASHVVDNLEKRLKKIPLDFFKKEIFNWLSADLPAAYAL